MEKVVVCLTGGGTGGHLFPLVNVVKALKREFEIKGWDYDFFYLGAEPFRREILEKEGIKIIIIPSAKWRRYFDFRNFLDIFKFPFGFLKSLFVLFVKMPNFVFSKGGFGTLEVVLSAWLLRIPIVIHESDSIPGISNRIAGKFASKIAVNFEKAKKYFNPKKTALIGQPLDPDFDEIMPTDEDYKKWNIDKNLPLILIVGGSQGSLKINETVIFSLDKLLRLGQVVHQLGSKLFKEYSQIAYGFILENVPVRKQYYHPLPFIEHQDLIKLLKMSTLIVSRAGAGAIFEIAAAGKPSILIPLPETTGGRHQIENAYEYSQAGASIVIEEKNFTPPIFSSVVQKVMRDEKLREDMGRYALEFSKKEATQVLVSELIFLVSEE